MDLQLILQKHKEWLADSSKGIRANLSRAILSGANLSDANLSCANLSGTDLSGANLSRANLGDANLSRANLSRAYLSGANLSRANLGDANLSCANLSGTGLSRAYLSGADLSGADLSRAILSGADLRCAYLSRADLSDANLHDANLHDANLSGANLSGAILSGADQATIDHILSFTSILPAGKMIVFKAARGSVVTLEVPEKACRVNYIGSRKCRAEYAKVLAIHSKIDGSILKSVPGLFNDGFLYSVGKVIRPDSYDPSPLNECSHGIHFFLTRQEAERWNG